MSILWRPQLEWDGVVLLLEQEEVGHLGDLPCQRLRIVPYQTLDVDLKINIHWYIHQEIWCHRDIVPLLQRQNRFALLWRSGRRTEWSSRASRRRSFSGLTFVKRWGVPSYLAGCTTANLAHVSMSYLECSWIIISFALLFICLYLSRCLSPSCN